MVEQCAHRRGGYTGGTGRARPEQAGSPPGARVRTGQGRVAGMATVNVLVRRPPEQVWDVLADGSAYAEWVVGTREIRAVDEGWPAVGTSLHYTIGVWPLELRGRTTVRAVEPNRRLGLEADAGLIGTARIVIDLVPWGDETVVELDESPLRGAGYRLHNAVSDAFLLLRGRPMVANLARLVEARHPG